MRGGSRLTRAVLGGIDGDDGGNAAMPAQWAKQDAGNECVEWWEQQSPWCEGGMTASAGHGSEAALVPPFGAA
jgi:hypothetical protein